MQALSLILDQIKELFSLTDTDVVSGSKHGKAKKLFTVDYSSSRADMFKDSSFEDFYDKDLESYLKEKELKEAKEDIVTSLTSLLSAGAITEELSEQIQQLISGDLNPASVQELQDLIEDAGEDSSEHTLIKDKNQINEILDSMSVSTKDGILEQAGGIDSVESVSRLENGAIQINAKNNVTVTSYPSGKYICSYNDCKRTGFDVYDENNKITNSTYIDHTRRDAVIQENYGYEDEGGYTKTIDNSNEPESQKIVEVSPENEIVSVKTKNKETGDVTINFTSQTEQGGSTVSDDTAGAGDTAGSSDSELAALEAEKQTVQDDLNEQQGTYEQTQSDKETELGAIDSDIKSGEGDLCDANDELSDACAKTDEAQSTCDEAAQQLDCDKQEADCAESGLNDATSEAEAAKSDECAAKEDNQGKIQEEQAAQGVSNQANDNLNTATGNTEAAKGVAASTGADLAGKVKETAAAFNVQNQKQAEVDAAQSEYNSAQAAKNDADESLWQKFKNWVSSAWNKLTDAIAGRDAAAREAEEKKQEEEKARAIDEEAQNVLETRQNEQNTAKNISDAAQVVLERKTGEREVSDQEYADALLDLADAMTNRDNASEEYDSALEQYMETYNYKVDADGNLVDAQGNQVSCEQVVEELEAFVQGLNANRTEKETTYNATLEATAAAISGDEAQIAALDNQINQLREKIAQEEQQIAMQEQLVTELAAQKGELNAAENSAGIGDDIVSLFGGGNKAEEESFKAKQEMLEKALISGNPEDIQAAYKAIYGDKEVVVDASGKVVDPSTLSEEELQTCSVAKVSDLSPEDITCRMQLEAAASVNAASVVEEINSGAYVLNGETVTMEQLNAALKAQAEELVGDMEDAMNQQGFISKGISGVNNLLGIGTSEAEAQAQVNQYKAMIERLDSCTDPVEYAALYKAITGSDFDRTNMACLLTYSSMTNPDSVKASDSAAAKPAQPGQIDLSEAVNEITKSVNEDADGNTDILLMTGNSRAQESIQDYIETQETAKNAVIGVATGVVTALAVAAAPFTGGASLLLAAGVGAGMGIGLNAADSIYDKDGDGKTDFNYTAKDALKDGVLGAANGVIGTVANGAGAAVTKAIGTNAAKTAVTTTFSQTVQKTCLNVGSKLIGSAVEGALDGGVSAGAEYTVEALTNDDVEFSLGKFAEVTGQGAAFGAVFNVGLTATGELASGAMGHFRASGLEDDINRALREGTSGNSVADMIAGKLDDNLKIDGQVNHYAVSQLMANAESSLDALKRMGLSENAAMSVLNDVPLETQAYLPKVIDTLRANNIISGGQNVSAQSVSDFIGQLDDVNISKKGDLTSMSFTNSQGTNMSFEFDKKGKLLYGIATNPDGSTIKVEYAADGSEIITRTPATEANNADATGLPAGDDAFDVNYRAYNADAPAGDAPAADVGGAHADADPAADVDIPPVDIPLADAPAGDGRMIYAKDIIQQSIENDSLDQVNWGFLLNDEYARIRETGAYAVDYGADGFEDAIEKVQAAIDPNDADGRFHNGVIVYDGRGTHWMYRGFSGECIERLSVNVKASADMIEELDTFMITGRYIDANGQLVQIDDVTKFSYKTPKDAAKWNSRQDPLTFYFGAEVNDETYNAIAQITGRHARGAVNNANPSMSWISAVEKNPTVDMVNNLSDQLQKYSPKLAEELRGNIKKDYYGKPDVNMSSGEFVAFENMLKYFQQAQNAA